MELEYPLISIVVLTYNSSKYILETLESVKAQSYQNIELIVTDDCSTDNTVDICREWMEENGERFVRLELVTSEVNTGIPANCNRGCKIAKGEWIKEIAGDDILYFDCLRQFVEFYHGENMIVVGNVQCFYENIEGQKSYVNIIEPIAESLSIYNATSKLQLNKLLRGNFVFAPSVFIKRKLFYLIGFYEEKYCLLEDYPFLIKYLKVGYKIDFVNILVTYYRYSSSSLTSNIEFYYNEKYYLCEYRFKKEVIYPLIPAYDVFYWQNELVQKCRFIVLFYIFHNRKSVYSEYTNRILSNLSIEYQINRIVRNMPFLQNMFRSCRNT